MSCKLDSSFSDLNDLQKDSVFILTTISDDSNIPQRFKEDKSDFHGHKIQLSIEFYNWLDEIERQIDTIDIEAQNNESIIDMKAKHKLCSDMLQEVDICLDNLNKLKHLYLNTSTKTNALHEACESLLKDQNSCTEIAKGIEERLRYYLIVDNLAMKISFPNLKVSVENIRPILDQIDLSFQFLSQKTGYKESSNYLSRLEELLWAVLNKIFSYFSREINNTFSQFINKEEISQEKSFTLLYGKFRTQAIKLRPFIELISSRKEIWDVYHRVFSNCEKCYISKREQLLGRIISCSIDDLVSKFTKDHCSFIRSGGALMMRLCDDELNLYQQFFVNSDLILIKEMLTRLCSILYDAFRPSIIHINHLETLSELCCILQMELVEDSLNKADDTNSPIDRMCQMILQDVQERLVYRTHVHIKTQILGFNPSPGDLAYPEKLEMMISIAESIRNSSSNTDNLAVNLESQSNGVSTSNGDANSNQITEKLQSHGDLLINPGPNMSLNPADLHGMWYPTVRRTLICLSKLQRCLDVTTFQGLSQECVSQCVHSLISASGQIQKNKTAIDSQLFLIKHLLILREQVAPFNVEFTVKETSLGFTNIKNAAVGLISSRSQILAFNRRNSLIRFLLETPEVIETVIDSRHQLDGQLKSVCDKFIADSIGLVVGPINNLLNKITSMETMAVENNMAINIREQPFAEIQNIQEVLSTCNREISVGKFGSIKRNLRLYLSNPDTENILLRPIKAGILRAYRNLNRFLTTYYSEEDCLIISCPSEKQVSLKMEVNTDSTK